MRLDGSPLLVSIKTIPSRIHAVALTIESVFRQSVRPTGVLLWVYKEDFRSIAQLPRRLQNLEKRGLMICFCDSNRSHEKLIPALSRWPDATLVTLDDDQMYSPHLLQDLIEGSRRFPQSIVCHSARSIRFYGNGEPMPYTEWTLDHESVSLPAAHVLPIGCNGVLYPPNSLHPEVFDLDLLNELCPTTDDLWFKVMAVRNQCNAVMVRGHGMKPIQIPGTEGSSLWQRNHGPGGNDQQWAAALDRYLLTAADF